MGEVIIILLACLFLFISCLLMLISEIQGLKYKGRTKGIIIKLVEKRHWTRYEFYYAMTATYRYIVDDKVYEKKYHCTEKRQGEYQLLREDIIRYDIKNPNHFTLEERTKNSREYICLYVVILIVIIILVIGLLLSEIR